MKHKMEGIIINQSLKLRWKMTWMIRYVLH